MKKYCNEYGYRRTGCYLGFYGIQFFDGGSYSDPILKYHGYYFNYYDIENALWDDFLEDFPNTNGMPEKEQEEMFLKWITKDYVKARLDDCIFGGYCFKSIQKLVASY